MEVLVILFQDCKLEGVAAVVAIPTGKTAEEIYEQWIAITALEHELDPTDPDYTKELESLKEQYPCEVFDVTTLPLLIAGLPLDRGDPGTAITDLI